MLRGRFGDVRFEQSVTVPGSSRTTVTLNASSHPELHLKNPQLWWPTGYGEPYLYDVSLAFEAGNETHDTKAFKFGVRQMTYSEEGGALKIWSEERRILTIV